MADMSRHRKHQRPFRSTSYGRITVCALPLLVAFNGALSSAFAVHSRELRLRSCPCPIRPQLLPKKCLYTIPRMHGSETERVVELERASRVAAPENLGEIQSLERKLVRMDSLEPYILVSVFMATSSYDTIRDTELITETGGVDFFCIALLMASTVSTLCGIYCTVIFSLSVLYGKAALGLGRDEMHGIFLEKTANQRLRGFQLFKFSLLFFMIEVLLEVLEKVPLPLKIPAAIGAVGSVYFFYSEFEKLVSAAEPIFTGVIPEEDKLG